MWNEKTIKRKIQEALKSDLDQEHMEIDIIARYFQIRALTMVLEGKEDVFNKDQPTL